MAKNLRTKINKNDSIFIHDVDPDICKQFVEEFKSVGPVTAAKDVREVAENSVCPYSSPVCCPLHDELFIFLTLYDLSCSISCPSDYLNYKANPLRALLFHSF